MWQQFIGIIFAQVKIYSKNATCHELYILMIKLLKRYVLGNDFILKQSHLQIITTIEKTVDC